MHEVKNDARAIARPLDWSSTDLLELTGKVALVTGATTLSSIGANIALELALRGAKVYIGGRNLQKAQAGIQEILQLSPSIPAANLQPFVAEIDDYAAVQAAAQHFAAHENRLDILVNNVGIFPLGLEYDAFGVNKVMATNHLGPFLLTTLLTPLLRRTALADKANDVRIVNVTSGAANIVPAGHTFSSLGAWNDDFGGEENENRFLFRYAYSKVANILFSQELQRRFDEEGVPIICMSAAPGVVATRALGKNVGEDSDAYKASISPWEGALTPVWCAAHPEVRARETELKGAYTEPFGMAMETQGIARDDGGDEARHLWRISEELLDTILVR